MTKRRGHGDGTILQRGDSFRLRYRIGKQRYSVTFHGSPSAARKKTVELFRSGDIGEHVAPDRMSLAGWAENWISIGCPGRKKRRAGQRSVERYTQLLRGHVLPMLGNKRLQQLYATDIDRL